MPSEAATIRKAAEEVLSRPEYQLSPAPDSNEGSFLWDQLGAWLDSWIEKLNGLLPGGGWARPAVMLLAGAIAAVAILTLIRVWRRRRRTDPQTLNSPQPTLMAPDQLEQEAEAAASREDYAAAARLLLRSSQLRIELAEKRHSRPGMTNREWLRARRGTPLHEPLSQLVKVVDVAWYGGRTCTASDFKLCQAATQAIRTVAGRIRDARQLEATISGPTA